MNFEVHLAALLSRSEEYSTTKKFKKQTLMNHFAGSRSKPGGLKIEISDIYDFKKKRWGHILTSKCDLSRFF